MRMSDSITELAGALAKAQGQIEDATKDATNPHFKMKYADLASVRRAVRKPLAENDLAVTQFLRTEVGGPDGRDQRLWVELDTMVLHKSGEWMMECLRMPVLKSDPQGIGSAATYARRYGLMAMLGVAPDDDDDGNAASEGQSTASRIAADLRDGTFRGETPVQRSIAGGRFGARGPGPQERVAEPPNGSLAPGPDAESLRLTLIGSMDMATNAEELKLWAKNNKVAKDRLPDIDAQLVVDAYLKKMAGFEQGASDGVA